MAIAPERVLIWGAGGHGKVVADLARARGHEIAGFVDSDPLKLGLLAEPGGAAVVASEQDLRVAVENGGDLPERATVVVPAIGDNRTRLRTLSLIAGCTCQPLIHPGATVSPSASLGSGTVVFAGAVVNAGASIGRAAIVNTNATVEHDCQVGDAVHVSPGAVLAGGVIVGTHSWIGAGAVVIEGRRIGSDVTVGAGAVVIRDVADGLVVVGNPAQPAPRAPLPRHA